MARKRRADSSSNYSITNETSSSSSATTTNSRHASNSFMTAGYSNSSQLGSSGGPRRRTTLIRERLAGESDGTMMGSGQKVKEINAATALEMAEIYGVDANNGRTWSSRAWALLGKVLIEMLPACLAVGAMLALIFGGCCSNVFALEAIIKVHPDAGTLLTFIQFVFVATTGYISQFDKTRPPLFIRPNKVPIRRWLVNIVLFFSINVLNNHAFSYNISVPVHIILRSGGSITTILAGYMVGKQYTRTQIFSVILLTTGVILAAYSDAQAKNQGKDSNPQGLPPFSMGLIILFVAQVLSAIMGLYTEDTYKTYGPQWKENLFYSHLLSLPLFIPFISSMRQQFLRLANSAPLTLSFLPPSLSDPNSSSTKFTEATGAFPLPSAPSLLTALNDLLARAAIPSQLAYLVANVLTQYACIRGVNLLAAQCSALSVTIVLNVRKLASLLMSIWLFGNRLEVGTMVGAGIVFSAGAMYGLDGGGMAANKKGRIRGKVG